MSYLGVHIMSYQGVTSLCHTRVLHHYAWDTLCHTRESTLCHTRVLHHYVIPGRSQGVGSEGYVGQGGL